MLRLLVREVHTRGLCLTNSFAGDGGLGPAKSTHTGPNIASYNVCEGCVVSITCLTEDSEYRKCSNGKVLHDEVHRHINYARAILRCNGRFLSQRDVHYLPQFLSHLITRSNLSDKCSNNFQFTELLPEHANYLCYACSRDLFLKALLTLPKKWRNLGSFETLCSHLSDIPTHSSFLGWETHVFRGLWISHTMTCELKVFFFALFSFLITPYYHIRQNVFSWRSSLRFWTPSSSQLSASEIHSIAIEICIFSRQTRNCLYNRRSYICCLLRLSLSIAKSSPLLIIIKTPLKTQMLPLSKAEKLKVAPGDALLCQFDHSCLTRLRSWHIYYFGPFVRVLTKELLDDFGGRVNDVAYLIFGHIVRWRQQDMITAMTICRTGAGIETHIVWLLHCCRLLSAPTVAATHLQHTYPFREYP